MKHLSHFSSNAILKDEVIKAVYDNRVKQTKVEVFQDSRDERGSGFITVVAPTRLSPLRHATFFPRFIFSFYIWRSLRNSLIFPPDANVYGFAQSTLAINILTICCPRKKSETLKKIVNFKWNVPGTTKRSFTR